MHEADDTFPLISSAELDSTSFDLKYLIDGILVADQPCIVAGPAKSLKTSLIAVEMALSLATGTPFAGRWVVPQSVRVAVISGESGMGVIQETARRVCRTKGLCLAAVEMIQWGSVLPRLGDVVDEAKLRQTLEKGNIDVLVVDPCYLAMADIGDDAKSLFKVGKVLRGLAEISAAVGCTPILIHHSKRSVETGAAPKLGDVAWAGFVEFARQWILTGRRTPYDPSRPGSHRLWLSVGGSAGHSGLWGLDIEEGAQDRPGGGGGRWPSSTTRPPSRTAKATDRPAGHRRRPRESSRRPQGAFGGFWTHWRSNRKATR